MQLPIQTRCLVTNTFQYLAWDKNSALDPVLSHMIPFYIAEFLEFIHHLVFW
jgi:hypothetical protein